MKSKPVKRERGQSTRDRARLAGAGRAGDRRRGDDTVSGAGRPAARRPEARRRHGGAKPSASGPAPAREPRTAHPGPQTAPVPGPTRKSSRPKNSSQAKARAKARKAKAPKVIRPPLRERVLNRITVRLETLDLRPQALLSRVPFVVLVIGSLGVGLGVTLWLSTYSAERSYQLGSARQVNQALTQQKEALERDVLEAQAAPALAEAARNLGMIPSRDTAHLVQDPSGNWIVVGTPKPAEGVPPPALNFKLPDDNPPPPPAPNGPERTVRLPGAPGVTALAAPAAPAAPGVPAAPGAPGAPVPPEVLVRDPGPTPSAAPLDAAHAPTAAGPAADPALGPPPGPALGPLPGPADAAPLAVPVPPAAAPAPANAVLPPAPPEQFAPVTTATPAGTR